MNFITYIIICFIFLFAGCTSKKITSKNIIGKWEGKIDGADLILRFTSDTFFYNEIVSQVDYRCSYRIDNDTLILNRRDSVDKHFISKVDKVTLRFDNLYGEYKDVPLLDGLTFNRILK